MMNLRRFIFFFVASNQERLQFDGRKRGGRMHAASGKANFPLAAQLLDLEDFNKAFHLEKPRNLE